MEEQDVGDDIVMHIGDQFGPELGPFLAHGSRRALDQVVNLRIGKAGLRTVGRILEEHRE
ncbi:hypothetical protein D9M70_472200 [compost metagenome]